MYLAPLNYDRFFRKVFSHEHIAKQFLEDFLEVTITDIKLLKDKKHLTDKSAKVEFDFRCTIGDADVIIDMQQWYKTDVVQRFYTYHTAGTVLQLEKLPDKKLAEELMDKRSKEKDYKKLKPVLTLIWMANDTLLFKENYVGYVMTPEIVSDFIRNVSLWKSEKFLKLLEEREKVLKIMANDAKDLDFLPKNRLIFLFQPNIAKDKSIKKYHRWFRFAEKTRRKDNAEADFEEYRQDPVFREIMRLIVTEEMSADDLAYIETEAESREMVQRFLEGEYNMGKKDGRKIGLQEGEQIGLEKGEQKNKRETAILMINEGEPNEKISKYTELTIAEIEQVRKEM